METNKNNKNTKILFIRLAFLQYLLRLPEIL